MRISRTHGNKKEADVIDIVYDHPIFFHQFYSKKRTVFRLLAWLQCTKVPQSVKGLIDYFLAHFYNKKYYPGDDWDAVKDHIVRIDEIPKFKKKVR